MRQLFANHPQLISSFLAETSYFLFLMLGVTHSANFLLFPFFMREPFDISLLSPACTALLSLLETLVPSILPFFSFIYTLLIKWNSWRVICCFIVLPCTEAIQHIYIQILCSWSYTKCQTHTAGWEVFLVYIMSFKCKLPSWISTVIMGDQLVLMCPERLKVCILKPVVELQ